jgi:hypothetical protein
MYFYGDFYRGNRYNNDRAVRYALTYALKPNPEFRFFPGHDDGGGDCTNFMSQCIKAGGAPMAFGSSPWWYRMNGLSQKDDRWAVSWAVAHSLYWTLKTRSKSRLSGLKAREVQDMQQLELGDIIQYEDKNGIIYHSAMVTAFANDKGMRVPLITQHSKNAINISYYKEKAKKMHFMKIEVS